MTYPIQFGALAAGNQPLSDFDTMFAVAGQQGNIPCTAAGTNTITLTPQTNYYVPASYTSAQIASFKAVNTSSGNVTLQIGGLSLLKLFTAAGVQAASGDVVSGTHYEVQYWADLDSSAGGFIILNATVTAIANSVQASHKGLVIFNNAGTPTTKMDISADAIIMQNAGGGTVRSTGVSLTCNAATNGANGLDTGSLANSTMYSIWIIFNANTSTTASLMSTSATSPTLPSGYTYQARVGWVPTDGSAHFKGVIQRGTSAQYTSISVASSGSAGNPSSGPTFVGITIIPFAPSTASRVKGYIANVTNSSNIIAAPNNAYGVITSTSNPPPVGSTNTTSLPSQIMFDFVVESTQIFWASNGASNLITIQGWEDNL